MRNSRKQNKLLKNRIENADWGNIFITRPAVLKKTAAKTVAMIPFVLISI